MKPAKSCNPRYIMIKPAVVEVKEDNIIKMTEESMAKQVKSQSRGEIVLMGNGCNNWVEPGDVVSFYRNASTTVKGSDGEEYLLVHEDHVLLKY